MDEMARKPTSNAKKRGAAAPRKNLRWNGMPTQKGNRREVILRSVANVLRNSRLSSLTIQEVADELGMTKGNLYYYFKDKQDILYHCHMRSMDISMRALELGLTTGKTPAEKLRILLVHHIRGIVDEGFGGILQTDLENLRAEQRNRYIRKRDQLEQGVRRLIEDGIKRGVFQCANVKLVGFAILGAINWIPKWYQPNGPFSADQISEEMADYFLLGLLRRDGVAERRSAKSRKTKDRADDHDRDLVTTEGWR
jgi:AcrR family transcriptional regulator